MTSTTDEIANLRAALWDIVNHCHTQAASCQDEDRLLVYRHIEAMAARGLKTPRASKVLTVGEIMDDSDMTTPRPPADPGREDEGYGPKGKNFCRGGCVP